MPHASLAPYVAAQCFISHASEDKESFVRLFAHHLKRLGVNVWYDEFSLRPGDSLRRSIDKGLTECEFGVVVLSPSFFAKEWPQRELDALLTAEIAGSKKLFPVWHGVDAAYVSRMSALLADRVALKSDAGVEEVAQELVALLPDTSGIDSALIADKLELFLSHETYVLEYLGTGVKHRFFKFQAFYTELQYLADQYFDPLSDDQIEEQQYVIEAKMEVHRRQLAPRFELPIGVEIPSDEPIPEERLSAWMSSFEQWVAGTLGEDETSSLLCDLETYLDIDYLHILFGLSNYSVSAAQRELLGEAIMIIGSWFETDGAERLLQVCERLRSPA